MPHRWKPNVTVAAVVERDGRYLLVEEQTSEGLQLNNPAGHLDPGESLVQACARETLEETAHRFTPTALLGVYMARSREARRGIDRTWLRVAFTGELGPAEPGRALDTGIVRTVWMTRDEIRASAPRHRSPLLLRCIDDHAAGRRLPLEAIYSDLSLFQPA